MFETFELAGREMYQCPDCKKVYEIFDVIGDADSECCLRHATEAGLIGGHDPADDWKK